MTKTTETTETTKTHLNTLGKLVAKADRAYQREFKVLHRYPRNGNVPTPEQTEKQRKKVERLLAEWSALVAAERALELQQERS